jgi:hypothetical protein
VALSSWTCAVDATEIAAGINQLTAILGCELSGWVASGQ